MSELAPETRLTLIEERLAMGGTAFAELRGKLGKLAWMAIGLIGTALFVAFAAGQVVSEVHEAREVQRETQGQLEQIRSATVTLERRQDSIEASVSGIQKALDTKLDRALAPASDVFGRRKPR